MVDPVRELKIRAELLHHSVAAGAVPAIERLRALPELRRASPAELATFAERSQRKHCLAAVARELGFTGWDHASRVLGGEVDEPDFGALLYPNVTATFLNHWFATYEEARAARVEGQGAAAYLLAYKRQSFIVGRDYVATTLGLDPDDRDWATIGFDWIRPRYPWARRSLYGKLLAARREAA
jgi:hypothetical protein